MNPILICGYLVALAVVASAANINSEWETFKSVHQKRYDSVLEESMRKGIFAANKEKVEHFNKYEAQQAGYEMGLNHLSDRTQDEMKAINGLKVPKGFKAVNDAKAQKFLDDIMNSNQEVPDEVDWRKVDGRVSEVKDQGQCGSCWAFASTGGLEGQMVVKNKKLISLSEQNLVDCSDQDHGCNGGFMGSAYEDIAAEGGIDDEDSYPYEAIDDDCRFNKTSSVFNDKAAAYPKTNDEKALKELVAKFGPVPIGIDASHPSFQLYKKGVYYEKRCSATALDHGVLIVGYGTDPKQGDYWIVKNSWSEKWGDKGYIKMARNKKNHCGIASSPIIPTF